MHLQAACGSLGTQDAYATKAANDANATNATQAANDGSAMGQECQGHRHGRGHGRSRTSSTWCGPELELLTRYGFSLLPLWNV